MRPRPSAGAISTTENTQQNQSQKLTAEAAASAEERPQRRTGKAQRKELIIFNNLPVKEGGSHPTSLVLLFALQGGLKSCSLSQN
jgi:hypothetical protein